MTDRDPLAAAREALQAIYNNAGAVPTGVICGHALDALRALGAADAERAVRDEKIRAHAEAIRNALAPSLYGDVTAHEHAEAILVLVGEPT